MLIQIAPKLHLTANDCHVLLTKIKGTHGRDFVNPKNQAGRKLLYFYIKAIALLHNTSLRDMSENYGKNGGYLFKLIRHTNRFSISRVIRAVPTLSAYNIQLLLYNDYRPFRELLIKAHNRVNNRQSLLKYLQCIACEHETSLSAICKSAHRSKSYIHLTVTNNLRPSVEYTARMMASILNISAKPLLSAVDRAHIKERASHGKLVHQPQVSLNRRLHAKMPAVVKDIAHQCNATLRELSRQIYDNPNQIWEIMNSRSLKTNYQLLVKIQKYTDVYTERATKLGYIIKLYLK